MRHGLDFGDLEIRRFTPNVCETMRAILLEQEILAITARTPPGRHSFAVTAQ